MKGFVYIKSLNYSITSFNQSNEHVLTITLDGSVGSYELPELQVARAAFLVLFEYVVISISELAAHVL
jgi:hypothetical protein